MTSAVFVNAVSDFLHRKASLPHNLPAVRWWTIAPPGLQCRQMCFDTLGCTKRTSFLSHSFWDSAQRLFTSGFKPASDWGVSCLGKCCGVCTQKSLSPSETEVLVSCLALTLARGCGKGTEGRSLKYISLNPFTSVLTVCCFWQLTKLFTATNKATLVRYVQAVLDFQLN